MLEYPYFSLGINQGECSKCSHLVAMKEIPKDETYMEGGGQSSENWEKARSGDTDYNPSTAEAEAEDFKDKASLGFTESYKASLGYIA
jgi:hypothetical protein